MLLAIDVGNTNIVVGVFDGSTLLVSWRLLTLRERTADEVGLLVTGLFDHARLSEGQTALIHGAGGGVGTLAVQLARSAGARVVATGRAWASRRIRSTPAR